MSQHPTRPTSPRPVRPAARALAPLALAGALAAAASACVSVRATTGRGAGVQGGFGGTGVTAASGRGAPGDLTVPGTAVGRDTSIFARRGERRAAAQGGAEGVRRVCRASAWPRGWVAVAYEPGGGPDDPGQGCPGAARADSGARPAVAVLVRHDRSPVNTRLDVCADQPLPPGWSRVRDEAPGDADACPGAAADGRPGAVRIVRVR